MKVKIIKSKKISSLILLCTILLTSNVQAQAVYDTLYIFPDTTTFYDNSIFIVGDITNLAVRFNVDSSWDTYQIERIIYVQPTGIDSTGFGYFFISIGKEPEDFILDTIKVFLKPSFPEGTEILIDPPLIINYNDNFYISGDLFTLSISDYFEYGIPGEYAFWFTSYKWIEYVPCYFNMRVIVKKNLTDVKEEPRIPCNFKLEQNYPNPFNTLTKIIFNSPENGTAEIEIYDILGNKMHSLSKISTQIGYNEFTLNAENFISGVYFYKLNVNQKFSSIKKMVLLK